MKDAGLPEKLAQEVADRVGVKVEEGWKTEKILEETSAELRRLYESIERVYEKFKSSVPMGEHNVGEQRISEEY